MNDIIKIPKSIIPACDVSSLDEFADLIESTCHLSKIGGYKIGFALGLTFGLPKIVEIVRSKTDLPIIYDHQKAGSDIPNTGRLFAKTLRDSGIDAAILFPQAGPATESAWIEALMEAGLGVIVGGFMTHKSYVQSEGGFIVDEAVNRIYEIAAQAGVREFVVPGTRPEIIEKVRLHLANLNVQDPVFHSPGFVAQGGNIDNMNAVAGDKWHAIVGRGIYGSKDKEAAARSLCSEIQ